MLISNLHGSNTQKYDQKKPKQDLYFLLQAGNNNIIMYR